MKKNILLVKLFLFVCICTSCKAQSTGEKNYIDAVIKGNKLYALTANGHINILNIETRSVIDANIHADAALVAINYDKKGNIIVAEKNNKIAQFNENDQTFKPLFKSPDLVYNIVFDSNNNLYLITDKGITDISTKKTYLPDTSFRLNKQLRGWSKPSAFFVDKDNNIWVGSGHGEWGGDLYVFATKDKHFIKPQIRDEILPVKSIFSDNVSVYFSSGLQHMITYGSIMKFTNFKVDSIIYSKDHWINDTDKSGWRKMGGGEYIGPATYNNIDSCIYFYSQNGVFKGKKGTRLSNIKNWTKIFMPKLHWTNGQSDAVGSPINVLKLSFTDSGDLLLITQNDGIGIYANKQFELFK